MPIAVAVYVFLMLWSVGQRAMKMAKPERTYIGIPLPNRDAAILQLPLLVGALVLGFAAIYVQPGAIGPVSDPLSPRLDAIYFSTVTIATVGYGDLHPLTVCAKVTVLCEIASGLLVLLFALPVAIARLGAFD